MPADTFYMCYDCATISIGFVDPVLHVGHFVMYGKEGHDGRGARKVIDGGKVPGMRRMRFLRG